QREFPYRRLVEGNRSRSRRDPELELIDTGAFDEGRYFDVFTEYAKASPDDVLIRIAVVNRGPDAARVHLLPTLWYRNTWSWDSGAKRPRMSAGESADGFVRIDADSESYGRLTLAAEGSPELLFTENESNSRRLWGNGNGSSFVKDGFHDYVVGGVREAVNPERIGSEAAALYVPDVPARGSPPDPPRPTRGAAARAPLRGGGGRGVAQRVGGG